MKGFKPTGYGPSAGFKFPAKMGFTGSTGSVTNVQPYVRRKAFANGGFVRQDNPRMKSEVVGDQGSALVRRSKPTTQLDQESGGRSPLRPGFRKGGYTGGGALGAALASRAKKVPGPGIKGKFAAARGGSAKLTTGRRDLYADGGEVKRGSSSKGFWSDLKQLPEAIREGVRYIGTTTARSNTGMAKQAGERISGRRKQIDDYVDEASTGRKNYSHGGKAKRMGYASGGDVKKKTVSTAEAKKIAERTVGEHVRYPAPKGHKGQRVCKADGGEVKRNAENAVMILKPGERRKTLSEMLDEARRHVEKEQAALAKDKRSLRDRMVPM